jgi:hypothetical protein
MPLSSKLEIVSSPWYLPTIYYDLSCKTDKVAKRALIYPYSRYLVTQNLNALKPFTVCYNDRYLLLLPKI